MKARSFGMAGLIFLLTTAFNTNAQEISNPVIKVLPSIKEGSVRLLVAEHDKSQVDVQFFSSDRTIATDKIDASKTHNGFMKSYDFNSLHEKSFWMAVKTNTTTVVYKITRGKTGVDAQLQEATYTYPMVASR
jgi:hypothetical protein